MSIGIKGILDAVTSHAQSLGIFDAVNAHEPKSAPGRGVACSIWADDITPALSGLNSTSARMTFQIRIQQSMLREPADTIDVEIVTAVDLLLAAYVANFTLGGLVRAVDVRGMSGEPLRVRAGYITQDQKAYRVMEILLPVIVNDVWTESP
jgi:hypothetical protein